MILRSAKELPYEIFWLQNITGLNLCTGEMGAYCVFKNKMPCVLHLCLSKEWLYLRLLSRPIKKAKFLVQQMITQTMNMRWNFELTRWTTLHVIHKFSSSLRLLSWCLDGSHGNIWAFFFSYLFSFSISYSQTQTPMGLLVPKSMSKQETKHSSLPVVITYITVTNQLLSTQ